MHMNDENVTADAATAAPIACRRFGLLDGMILLAGAAIALSVGAHLFPLLFQRLAHLCELVAEHGSDIVQNRAAYVMRARDDARNTLWYGLQSAEAIILGLTPAYLIVRFRKPRAGFRALVQQPGTMACLGIVFGAFWITGLIVYLLGDKADSVQEFPMAIGGTVAVVWTVAAVFRGWKPEPGWIDRLGRILGFAAMTTALLAVIVFRM